MGQVLITNIGKIVSGDTKKGILPGDTILVENNLIAGVGKKHQFDSKNVEKVVDANGLVVIPGLIDTHTHPFLEDWTPICRIAGWMEGELLSGVTTLISAETETEGLVYEPLFVKSLAIIAEQKYRNIKPGGYLKVMAGTVIPVMGLTEGDFREMANAGVRKTTEIGCSGLAQPGEIKDMVKWARKYGMVVTTHCGGRWIPGSTNMTAEMIMEIKPDLVCHINGGATPISAEGLEKLVNQTDFILELIYNGNPKAECQVVRMVKEKGALHRLVIGSDSPIGFGHIKYAIMRTISRVSSLNQVSAPDAIAMGTGNTADTFHLNTGKIEVGKEADLLIIDRPLDSQAKDALEAIEMGDTVGPAMIMVDGRIVSLWGRACPRITKNIKINGVEQTPAEGFEEWGGYGKES